MDCVPLKNKYQFQSIILLLYNCKHARMKSPLSHEAAKIFNPVEFGFLEYFMNTTCPV